jgi:signal transduction histidine kinase
MARRSATVPLDVVHAEEGAVSVDREREGASPAVDALAAFRPEWLIDIGRVITAVFAVLAIYLDPTQPEQFRSESEAILGLYFVFSLALVIRPLRKPLDDKLHLLSHGIDIIVLGGLSLLTNELTSPFFSFLPYVLLATTLRWGLSGALLGATVLQVVLVLIAWPDLGDGDSELNIAITRSAYFLVAAGIMGFFGISRDRSRQRLARLANWSPATPNQPRHIWVRDILHHASNVLGGVRLIILWTDLPAGESNMADYAGDQLHLRTFDATSPIAGEAEAQTALARELNEELDVGSGCAAPFSGLSARGWVFVIESRGQMDENRSLTEIIAARVAAEFERAALFADIARAARAEERARLARDLHDSILQDLTAAGLQVKAVGAKLPEVARQSLAGVNTLLLDQQRRVRRFVELGRSASETRVRFSERLTRYREWLSVRWPCEVTIDLTPIDAMLGGTLLDELWYLLAEATANAVQHGGASEIAVKIECSESMLNLEISDNGSGLEAGREKRLDPESLRNRAHALGGSLTVVRSSPGVVLRIELPSGVA